MTGTDGTAPNHGIDPSVPPSGTGCADCEAVGGWWMHLRRCAQCGHIGCCDTSPAQHATAHWKSTGHPLIQSFEPGEDWYWNYETGTVEATGPALAPPSARPEKQTAPGPAERLPADWTSRLHT
ncbi:UBP-type zinc finger domain-containing protein [Streptomyces sp. NPDC097619]|uniref:UBP-type zinc finger domain-containing protein n=1 Tax=Streptomyces sp. NPDC097619 TaxID=3157228 RepID=UPI00332FB496